MAGVGVQSPVGPPVLWYTLGRLFLSVAGGRTHIGTYVVGVSPSPASNENNKEKSRTSVLDFSFHLSTEISSVIKTDGRTKVIIVIFFR